MSGATSRPDTQGSIVDLEANIEADGTVSFRVGGIVAQEGGIVAEETDNAPLARVPALQLLILGGSFTLVRKFALIQQIN